MYGLSVPVINVKSVFFFVLLQKRTLLTIGLSIVPMFLYVF